MARVLEYKSPSNHIAVKEGNALYDKGDPVVFRQTDNEKIRGFADYASSPGKPLSINIGRKRAVGTVSPEDIANDLEYFWVVDPLQVDAYYSPYYVRSADGFNNERFICAPALNDPNNTSHPLDKTVYEYEGKLYCSDDPIDQSGAHSRIYGQITGNAPNSKFDGKEIVFNFDGRKL